MQQNKMAPFDRRYQMPYPTDHTVCFLNSFDDVENLLSDFEGSGIDIDHVDLLYGQEGLEMIDLKGDCHSFYEKLVRIAQRFWGSGEWVFFEIADDEMRKGHYLIVVATPDENMKQNIVDLMRKNNSHDIKYFNSMFVEHFSRKNMNDFDEDRKAERAADHSGFFAQLREQVKPTEDQSKLDAPSRPDKNSNLFSE